MVEEPEDAEVAGRQAWWPSPHAQEGFPDPVAQVTRTACPPGIHWPDPGMNGGPSESDSRALLSRMPNKNRNKTET